MRWDYSFPDTKPRKDSTKKMNFKKKKKKKKELQTNFPYEHRWENTQ
jgi:hypothetical protein